MGSLFWGDTQGVSIGVFIQKGPEDTIQGASFSLPVGFIDKKSHQDFVQNVFATSQRSADYLIPQVEAESCLAK